VKVSRETRRFVAVLAAAWLVAAPARAQPAPTPGEVEEARKHYARGVELYEQHADTAALGELERAYELAPNWKVLYELAVVELALHDFAASLGHFEQYLDQGKEAVKGARREEVIARIAQLQQEVGTIDLVTAAGAELKVDDVDVGTAPLAKPLILNPGHHKLAASKDGVVAESRAISVAGGDRTRVELLIPAPVPAPVPSPSPAAVVPPPLPPSSLPGPAETLPAPRGGREETSPPSTPYPPWLGFSATGLFASGAIVTGIEALSASSSLSRAKSDGPSTAATLGSLASRAHAFALASDILSGSALLVGGVTLYFTLRAPRTAPAPAPAASASLAVGLGRVSIEASF
jgi:hypothetical protein